MVAALLAVVIGGLMELAQGNFTVTRTADWGDLLADAVGAAAVIGVARLGTALRSGGRWPFRSFVSLVLLACLAAQVCAEESAPTVGSELNREASRLWGETKKFVTTPFDPDGYGLLGTLAVGGAVGLTYIFDNNIRTDVQGIQSGTLNSATDVGSFIGNPLFHLGVAAAVYGGGLWADAPRWRETGAMLGEAAILADAATMVLKEGIGRGRPGGQRTKDSFKPFQFRSDYDSMPSMHTASSFAMASIMTRTSDSLPVGVLSYTTALFVGFSRIYQDHHWASDVVLGAAIGELSGWIVTRYHADEKRSVAIVPAISSTGASLAVTGHW